MTPSWMIRVPTYLHHTNHNLSLRFLLVVATLTISVPSFICSASTAAFVSSSRRLSSSQSPSTTNTSPLTKHHHNSQSSQLLSSGQRLPQQKQRVQKRSTTSATTTRLYAQKQPFLPNFCSNCGNPDMVLKIPAGDERLRACCDKCGHVEYSNPKPVVACVVRTSSSLLSKNADIKDAGPAILDRTLVAKRAIEPRSGTWGIPQGYMEHGETSRQAAVREVYEETGVVIGAYDKLQLRAVYNVPGSVQLVYEAQIVDPQDALQLQHDIDAYISKIQQNVQSVDNDHPAESSQVALVSDDELANLELCFPTVQWALDHCRQCDSSSTSNRIQQMTKVYDSETETWNQFEDEPILQ